MALLQKENKKFLNVAGMTYITYKMCLKMLSYGVSDLENGAKTIFFKPNAMKLLFWVSPHSREEGENAEPLAEGGEYHDVVAQAPDHHHGGRCYTYISSGSVFLYDTDLDPTTKICTTNIRISLQ